MPTFREDTKIGGMVPMMKTDDINDQAITKDKIRDGNVTAEKLADGAVRTDKLPDGAIKTPKISDGNITTSKLAEASVVTSKIADQNVTNEKIADQSVDNSKLSPEAVTYDKLKDKAIITEKLNDRAVTTEKVEEKAITNAKIGDSAVDGRVISEASVEKKHLANDSVSTEKLQDSAITSDKIRIHAVTEEKIEDSAISNSKLADNSVGTSKIKDGNVTNEKVANNTITIDKFDPELRKSIQAATGLPENLVEVIQDVDVEVKSLHSKDEDLQSQIADKQQQITANDKDIESLQNRSTQMEQSINNIAVTGGASVANTVTYSNTASGLVSINAQGAIDELAAKNATKAEKAEVTAELEKKFDKESILQESGEAEDKVMSQKAVSDKLSDLSNNMRNEYAVMKGTNLINLQTSKVFLGFVDKTLHIKAGDYSWSNDWNSIIVPVNKGITLVMYIETNHQQENVIPLSFFSSSSLNTGKKIECNEGVEFEYTPDEDGFVVVSTFKDTCKIVQKENTNYYFGSSLYFITELEKKINKTSIAQGLGDDETKVASQKCVTEAINESNTKVSDLNTKLNDLSNNIIGFSKSFTFNKVDSYIVSLSDVKFKEGQYACIMVKTTPAITTTYNGNATNMSNPYPSLKITDGFGIVVVGPATSDNAFLGSFGYGEAGFVTSEHTAEFTIFQMESADELPIKVLTQKNTENIQKNTADIDKIKKSINEPIDSFSKSFTFDKEGNTQVYLNDFKLKKGQYAMVLVKTTPAVSTSYNGVTNDMTTQYPNMVITDGFGEIVLGPATSDNAYISVFGYGSSSFVTEHTAEFTIIVMESAEKIPVKALIQKNTEDIQKNTEDIQKNTEDIQKNAIGWQEENIPSLLETPFEHNFRVPGYTAIIRSWGFIGDSLCSGEMECFEGETRKFVDMYEYSWGQQICRLCGSEGYNYSNGGQTAEGWIYSQERGWGKAKTNPHQAYIIALGVNDAAQAIKGNIETDVDFDNYENNANTFAGNYCGIIQRIRSVSQRSIIFVVSDPKNNELNDIIKATPSKFKNVFLIDLTSLIPLYSNVEFNKKYKMNGHLNAAGYLFTAYMFMHYIDYIIQNNPAIFTDIALWNTNYTAQAT